MARVLVVDDEPDYRSRLQFFLSQDGHETRAAATGYQAQELAATFHPDILVVDWMLGTQHTGLDVARQLTQDFPRLKVILITGFVEPALHAEVGELEIFCMLPKPFSSRELLQAVNRAVENHDSPHGSVGS